MTERIEKLIEECAEMSAVESGRNGVQLTFSPAVGLVRDAPPPLYRLFSGFQPGKTAPEALCRFLSIFGNATRNTAVLAIAAATSHAGSAKNTACAPNNAGKTRVQPR